MTTETQLKGTTSLGNYSYTEILEHNIKAFFDWGFINKDGFINVEIPSSGAYGGDFSRLRHVRDPRYTNGRVWEAVRGNWVWESGLESSNSPIQISGVFVNNVFLPTSGGQFHINYPNGQVIFTSGINTNSTVRIAYSHKWINVVSTDSVPWLRRGQQRSFRVDNSNFLIGSGDFTVLKQSRLDLPMVAVEIVGENYKGYQLGGWQYCFNRVKFYVIAEDKSSAERISHIIANQNEKTIFMFDSNLLAQNNAFPLDYRGSIANNAKTYPDLVDLSGNGGFRYTNGLLHGKVSFIDADRQEGQQLTDNIYQKVVTLETEAVLTKI